MAARHLTLLCLILALPPAACSVGPTYRGPEVEIDAGYGPAAAPAATAPSAATAPLPDASARWWTALNDPVLDRLIATAADNNLDLQQARARIREARAQLAFITGREGATVDANAEYMRTRFSQNAAPYDAFDLPNFPWEFNTYQAGFDASWEIDVFGGTRRAVQASGASLDAAEEDRRAVRVSLLGEVARNYVELRGAQQQQLIAQHTLETRQETLDLTRNRAAQGVATQLDVARASAEVFAISAQIPIFERREWQAIDRLAVLTHQPLDSLLFLRQSAPIPAPPASVVVGVPADLLRRRPDIRRAERQLAAATARVGVAEADLYPKFYLTGYFNLQSASVEDFFDWRSRAFSIGPTIAWPIFQSGRLRALVGVRNAQREQALLTYEQTVDGAIQEVRDQAVALSTERRRHDALVQAVAADQESLELARGLYAQGLTDFLTVLDAQRQLFLAQDALALSDISRASSLIALYKALGGGWGGGDAATDSATTQPAATTPAVGPPVPVTPATASLPSPKENP